MRGNSQPFRWVYMFTFDVQAKSIDEVTQKPDSFHHGFQGHRRLHAVSTSLMDMVFHLKQTCKSAQL